MSSSRPASSNPPSPPTLHFYSYVPTAVSGFPRALGVLQPLRALSSSLCTTFSPRTPCFRLLCLSCVPGSLCSSLGWPSRLVMGQRRFRSGFCTQQPVGILLRLIFSVSFIPLLIALVFGTPPQSHLPVSSSLPLLEVFGAAGSPLFPFRSC